MLDKNAEMTITNWLLGYIEANALVQLDQFLIRSLAKAIKLSYLLHLGKCYLVHEYLLVNDLYLHF